ncbi:MAG: BlaI/MecI/CopY family transcriptional regulator [Planctomycetota bacterium]
MAKQRPLSAAQLKIMDVVWDRGEVSVAEVWAALGGERSLTRNTVQTTMTRLEDKGWLTHRSVGQSFLFRAAHPRADTLKTLVTRLVDTAFRGSAEGLVMALVDGRGLSADERRRIVALINAAEAKKGRRA